ncbi:TRAP transporter small permease [Tahibacter soli]|uniref:TRAP transporter small permease protein n=1 Tax=Tahibacter soli TaxID=2983605 RepID=A0A9X3YQA2_9GAMM|nr:TRAP transporter small permease [Tahibacter soli]MDC8015932.1 TRAP transporter small permease [Tahibacter soli]
MQTDNPMPGHPALAALARSALLTAGAALVAMAAVEAWQVFARYVLNDSPGWTEPVALFLLNTAMSLGAAAGVRLKSHFGFFMLAHAAPPPVARALEVFAILVIAALGAVIAAWGVELLVDGWSIAMAGTRLPQSAAFLPMSVGGALMCVFAIERLVLALRPTATEAH